MTSADGPNGPDPHFAQKPQPVDGSGPGHEAAAEISEPVAQMLFESLVHHLIEKGVLTKNDALSVVQTVAEVKRGDRHSGGGPAARTRAALQMLQRIYASFEAAVDNPAVEQLDGHNVHRLRPPLHRDRPEFPRSD